MAVFKCKMCGGELTVNPGETVVTCDYCGSRQTLPKLDDERRANLYDRANHFRRNNDYDKAMSIYNQILDEDKTDAEAYWNIVLCRYGIEYVEDPTTHKRVPTVNRAQYTSIYADEDYKCALQNADVLQKSVYEEEAKAIDDIQKGILEISAKEDPFDVFISFKETDANGRRTPDSVLANELYHQLTQEGFKVFFAPITLEDKLGSEYEPYIFAALNSAKAMVVLGTKPEYFNAVWVKNEWSRYLALIKNGAKKILIPAFRDMDPYDLPDEFSHLMAQDMSKLGFMQDLIRGIKKLVSSEEKTAPVKETVTVQTTAPASNNIAPLLERAFMALEDEEWQKADEFCEQVLNQDAKNAQAYLGKLMAEIRARTQNDIKYVDMPFDNSNNYQKVCRFDSALAEKLNEDIKYINDRNENARLTGIYENAVSRMQTANTEADYKSAADAFATIPGFKDAAMLAEQCLDKAEVCRKDSVYASAKNKMTGEKAASYEEAICIFRTISGWKDADEQIYACQKKIEEIKAKEESDRLEAERKAEERRIAAEKATKKRKKAFAIGTPVVVACIAFVIVLTTVIIPNSKYNAAVSLMDAGQYQDAIAAFEAMDGYMDSAVQIENCNTALKDIAYNAAVSLLNDGKIIDAYESLIALNGYKDSATKASEIFAQYKIKKLKIAEVGDFVYFGAYEQDNNTSNGKEDVKWIVFAKENGKALVISKYALDCQPYNTESNRVTWETCSLRKWLNSTFLNNAFSSDEQAKIATTNVSADNNPKQSTDPGKATNDKVFLLSITEVDKYFSSDSARECSPTAYAKAQGCHTSPRNDNCYWWLRSPGGYQNGAAYVYYDGSVSCSGNFVDEDGDCVRPALWINLES